MKLIIYNGSPRGRKSNTKLLMDEFMKGMYAADCYDIEMYYLAIKTDRKEAVRAYESAENVLLAFPLYTDSMPGLVKEFMEDLAIYSGRENNPKMAYLVQSGFPEPAQSRFVEHYLVRYTDRMNAEYLGTIVKGGVEGIQIMPSSMTRKLYGHFERLGKTFALSGKIDEKIVKKLAPHEHLSRFRLFMFRLAQKLKMTNFYWDQQLKEHKVFDIRYDKPYIQTN